MYTVESIQHVEDWYVVSDPIESFDCFDLAIQCFIDKCMWVINDNSSGSGIDIYMSGDYQAEYDEDWAEDLAIGFLITILKDDCSLVVLHFDYDHKTHSVSCDIDIEFDDAELNPLEILKIRQGLITIQESLTNRL